MAGIDSSIYSNLRGIDLAGVSQGMQQGMQMRQAAEQRQRLLAEQDKQRKLQEAYAAGVTIGPDGAPVINQSMALSALAGEGFGQEALALDTQAKAQALAKQQRDQDQANKDREFKFQQQKLAADTAATKALQSAKLARESATGENLPLDQKKVVETLSSKNAGKISIQNQIEAVMSGWDSLTDDQKYAAGGQLIKTLNSTEGADAVGEGEAKRLAGKLQFATGNLFNSNPIQFGRDYPGFKEQALNTAAGIRKAVESNQSVIDKSMGRTTGASSVLSAAKPAEIDSAFKWAKANPQDPRSAEIMRRISK